jgi:hypothetical protein
MEGTVIISLKNFQSLQHDAEIVSTFKDQLNSDGQVEILIDKKAFCKIVGIPEQYIENLTVALF